MSGLSCRGLTASYGRLTVLRDLDLDVVPGEVLAVLGPNGAGKSTLLGALAGFVRRRGLVAVDGVDLPPDRPRAASRAGVVLVPDNRALFSRLTVEEHVAVARRPSGPTFDEVLELFPSLAPRRKLPAGELSGGEQQMVALARALVQDPKVLLVDELSLGLAPSVVDALLPVLRRLADERHVAVVLVEQHVDLALAVADRAIVLVHGRVALGGPAAELAADRPALEAAYLGG